MRAFLSALLCAAGLPAAEPIRSAIGVTREGAPIECLLSAGDFDYLTAKTRILLVGGLDNNPASTQAVRQAIAWFHGSAEARRYHRDFAVSAVPDANPGRAPEGAFPPIGDAYAGTPHPEAMYLWRWIGMHAPDLVLEVRAKIAGAEEASLTGALRAGSVPAGTGSIPARQVGAETGFLRAQLRPLEPSPARRAVQRRLARSPREVARELEPHYGHELGEAVYIPAVALIGRLRLGLAGDVERIVAPYAEGARPALGPKPTGSHLSGHLVFAELSMRTGDRRYVDLVRAAADLGFHPDGSMKESMPFHNEMSDAVFMGCPILAKAGRLTGEGKYFDMSLRHMRFMLKLNLRTDGLHRHSPLDETAWGRGNGFPALGLALSLEDLPLGHPGRPEMLGLFRAHMEALLKHQDPTGTWHQVIDRPESYRELTATAMIACAMRRGVRQGWIEKRRYEPAIARAWDAVKSRVASDGSLVDVCTGTGKQRSLRDYYDRTAILGRDPRGGAMALLLATEMMDAGPVL